MEWGETFAGGMGSGDGMITYLPDQKQPAYILLQAVRTLVARLKV